MQINVNITPLKLPTKNPNLTSQFNIKLTVSMLKFAVLSKPAGALLKVLAKHHFY